MSIILKNIFSVEFVYMWIRVVTPILLPALGGSLCNQAGVVNLGLEGMMLLAALGGVLGGAFGGSLFWGLVGGLGVALLVSLVFAYFHLNLKANAVLCGTAINTFAAGAKWRSSDCCACVDYPELLRCAEPIIRESGFTGPAMLEFKCGADGAPRLLEINPRVWGTYPLTHISGSDFSYAWFCLAAGLPLPVAQAPKPCRMVYYPSDFAAGLGYLKAGRPGAFLSVLKDFLNPAVKNGLASPGDPGPARAYFRGLFHRGGRK